MTKIAVAAALASTSLVSVALDEPIVRGDTTIGTLQIRKPAAGELRGLSLKDIALAETDAMIVLLPRITMPPVTEDEVAKMGIADFLECANQVSGFLPQKAANTASQAT